MRIFIILLLLPLSSAQSVPQDTTGTVVILSDKIGPTINLKERNFYGLFKGIHDFESAVLLQRPDVSYIFKVFTEKKDESSASIRWISITEEEIELVRLHIAPDDRKMCSMPQLTEAPKEKSGADYRTYEVPQSSDLIPSVSHGRIVGEIFAGALGTWLGGLPPFKALQDVGRKVKGDEGYSPTANAGLILGSILGNSIFVYLAGSSDDAKNSYLITVLGTTLASAPLAFGIDDPYLALYALTFGIILQDLGSIIGFNRSRRHRISTEAGTGLINLRNGKASLSIPTLHFQSNPIDGTALLQYKICVMQGFVFN